MQQPRRRDDEWPTWIPLFFCMTLVVVTVMSLAQRNDLVPPQPIALLALGMAGPCVVDFFVSKVPEWLYAAVVLTSTGLLMHLQPVDFDLAMLLLYVMVGEIAAMASVRTSVLTALAAAGLLLALDVNEGAGGSWVWALGTGVCWQVGITMRVLKQQLAQERELHAERAEQAAVAERQRIAREIHDVVAHSLSVTMLHITAARHALSSSDDAGSPGADMADITEATEALAQAEQVGRQAMADIRRTVGLLRSNAGAEPPMPGATEVPALLDSLASAGEQVRYSVRGDLATVPASVGLGLYRIVQESVANAVKHAPGRPLSVRLDVSRNPARLSMRNPMPSSSRSAPRSPLGGVAHGGAGVPGMRQRAELLGGTLRAGRRRGHWVVDLRFPLNVD